MLLKHYADLGKTILSCPVMLTLRFLVDEGVPVLVVEEEDYRLQGEREDIQMLYNPVVQLLYIHILGRIGH